MDHVGQRLICTLILQLQTLNSPRRHSIYQLHLLPCNKPLKVSDLKHRILQPGQGSVGTVTLLLQVAGAGVTHMATGTWSLAGQRHNCFTYTSGASVVLTRTPWGWLGTFLCGLSSRAAHTLAGGWELQESKEKAARLFGLDLELAWHLSCHILLDQKDLPVAQIQGQRIRITCLDGRRSQNS